MSGLDGLGWPNPEDEPKRKEILISNLSSLGGGYQGYFKVIMECYIPTTDENGSCVDSIAEYLSKNPKFAASYANSATIEYTKE